MRLLVLSSFCHRTTPVGSTSIATEDSSSKLMMWLVYSIIFGSVAISGSLTQQWIKNSNQSNQVNAAAAQQETVPQPFQGQTLRVGHGLTPVLREKMTRLEQCR